MDTTAFYQPNYTPVDRKTWKNLEERLPITLFQKNRARFFSLLHSKVTTKEGDFALLRGASEVPIYNSDIAYPEY